LPLRSPRSSTNRTEVPEPASSPATVPSEAREAAEAEHLQVRGEIDPPRLPHPVGQDREDERARLEPLERESAVVARSADWPRSSGLYTTTVSSSPRTHGSATRPSDVLIAWRGARCQPEPSDRGAARRPGSGFRPPAYPKGRGPSGPESRPPATGPAAAPSPRGEEPERRASPESRRPARPRNRSPAPARSARTSRPPPAGRCERLRRLPAGSIRPVRRIDSPRAGRASRGRRTAAPRIWRIQSYAQPRQNFSPAGVSPPAEEATHRRS
jgi:hypothetical protein